MKHAIAAAALAVSVFAAPAARADGMTGNTQFHLGQRWMDNDLWQPLDEPMSFGMASDFAPASSPVRAALGFQIAFDKADVTAPFFDDTGDVGVVFAEFSVGFLCDPVKKGVVRPYIGAGVLQMYGATGSDWNFSDGDHTFGFYGTLGMYFKVGEHFNVGFDGRIVRGTDLTIVGRDVDGDYEQASMLIGFSWGGGSSEPASVPETPPEPDNH